MRQNSVNSVSLQYQESICSKFAYDNDLNIISVYREVHSAFTKMSPVLSSVINLRNYTILISDISRFSRSVSVGLEMAKMALQNNNRLVFIHDEFVCARHDDFKKLTQFLHKTEDESKTIGRRTKNAREYLIENGMYAGGSVPYGYTIIDRRPIENKHEKEVLRFISICQRNNISSVTLNKIMSKIVNTKVNDPIECCDKSGKVVTNITEKLTNAEIADLLNSYNVYKRGIPWKPLMIKTALESNSKQISNNKRSNNVKKNKKSKPCDNLNDWYTIKICQTNTRSPKRQKTNCGNEITNKVNHLVEPMRRSARLNHNMLFDNTIDNTIDNNMDNSMDNITHDVQLFNQFREFRKLLSNSS
jgi:DNA invertase Pin-like site-specific DNA recombinase